MSEEESKEVRTAVERETMKKVKETKKRKENLPCISRRDGLYERVYRRERSIH